MKALWAAALPIPVGEGWDWHGTSAWRLADHVSPIQGFLKPAWALPFDRPRDAESKRTQVRSAPFQALTKFTRPLAHPAIAARACAVHTAPPSVQGFASLVRESRCLPWRPLGRP